LDIPKPTIKTEFLEVKNIDAATLNRHDIESGRTGLPFLDKIPLLKYLASTENDNKKNTSLFVFLKPIILRDDKFKDLKYLSDRDARSAQIRSTLPQSRPLVME
jgi:type II secretory pathway component GspD/PulD (secretin)